MEGLIFIAVLIILIVPVLTILNLIKTGKVKDELTDMKLSMIQLKAQIRNLTDSLATKNDLNEIKDILSNINQVQPLDNQYAKTAEETKETDISEVPTPVDTSIEDLLNAVAASHNKESEVEKEEIDETKETNDSPQHKQEEEAIEEEKAEEVIEQAHAAFTKPELPLIPKRYIPDRKEKKQSEATEVHEKSWVEKLFTENLLTKIGIVTLVLGIAFFVKYAIDQDWINEVGRVAIGILTGAILIGIAHKLRQKYHAFSSILVGGAIAVFYFTITLAFREYELFPQGVAFGILIVITILSVLFSLFYDSRELAVFSLLGGFASPLMISTGEGNYVILFTFILILNSGMLVLSVRKHWHIIGTISYVLTLIFYLTWLIGSFNDEVAGGLVFAILFYIQFYILTVIDHFNANRKLSVYHAILLLTNNLFLLASCLRLLNDVTPDMRGIAVILMALFNAAAMIGLYKTKKIDTGLIYLLIAIILSLVTLAIPIQLEGNAITMFWAAETVILIWLWKRSKIKTFSYGFVVVLALVLVSYAMDLSSFYNPLDYYYSDNGSHPAIIFNRMFITGVVIVLSFVANIWFTKGKDDDTSFILPDIKLTSLNKIFKVLLIISAYIVIFIELNSQLSYYIDLPDSSSFRIMTIVAYTGVYVTLLTIIAAMRKIKLSGLVYTLLYALVIVYAICFAASVIDLRGDIFFSETYSISYFYMHFLPLVSLAVIITYMAKISKKKASYVFKTFCWIMSLVSVFVLSVEADNIAMLMFSYPGGNDYNILDQVRTFVYPILWGVIAMILMVWGLKSRQAILRQISLVFFAVIIVKFYAYDVWRMSQAGRIISFVILGVILLVVSFLQQKIKTLVKEDKVEDSKIEEEVVENNN